MNFDEPMQFNSLKLGVVTGDNDPERRGRVLISIPGIFEESVWAEVCMPGSPFNRGMYVVPAIGGQVVVAFLDGDRDLPLVLGGIAPPVLEFGMRTALPAAVLPKFVTIENEQWMIRMGAENSDAPMLEIFNRRNDGLVNRIVIDGETGVIEIHSMQGTTITSDGNIRVASPLMNVNDRPVTKTLKPL